MLKGIQKNVVYVQLPRGKYFEGAYFIMRRGGGRETRQGEMVREANKIIMEMEPTRKKGIGAKIRDRLCFFLYGALAGAILVALSWLVTLIIC